MSKILKPEITCKTAKEFLDIVLPSNYYFGERLEESTWLFRGQGSDYPLIPSLFRTDEKSIKKLQDFGYKKNFGYAGRLALEASLLYYFFKLSDKQGLPIPDDSQELRSMLSQSFHFKTTLINDNGQWSSSGKVLSLMALAQHYGIPTRLLDWSLNPLVAAFFAAESGIKGLLNQNKKDEKIVFWAFRFPQFQYSLSNITRHYSIKGVTASGSGIPNLRAQQGVFTIVDHNHTNEKENDYWSLGNIIEGISTGGFSRNVDGCELQKITLLTSESIKLIELLSKLDVTYSSIYPGYQSVVSDIKMKNFFTDEME